MSRLKYALLLVFACLIACEPSAPVPTPGTVAVLPTETPRATAVPSLTPTATATASPTPTPLPPTPTATPTATPWVCTEKTGKSIDLRFNSRVVQGQEVYRVYLPPCYFESGKRYPYVILMHGSDQDQTEWIDQLGVDKALEAGLALKALPPMILVMPNGGELANTNIFYENRSWESFILKDLMPEIEKNFCTWNEREGRAIGGISRGGFWAFEIGLRHPDLFSAIGGHSPFFDKNNAPPAYNPLNLASSAQFPPGMQPRIWLDLGHDDYARQGIEDFRDALLSRNIDPGYTLNPTGGHTVDYWAAHVAEYLAFYGQTWPRDTQDLPSCLQ